MLNLVSLNAFKFGLQVGFMFLDIVKMNLQTNLKHHIESAW